MTLEQLRIFVAVAEREHMTRAADALNITQSAASAAIRALESRHGVALFHRVGRRIELTPAGRVFLEEARAVLARAGAAERVLADMGGLVRGTLAVQASQTIASYWLPAHLVRFRAAFPGIDVHLAVGNTARVARGVADGAAELGFVEGAVDDPALAQTVVGWDRMVLVVAPGHPWAGAHALPPAVLAEGGWVLREPGSGTRSVFEAALAGFGVDHRRLRVAFELPSNEAVRAAVVAGGGATVLSALVAEGDLRAGTLVRVAVPFPDRPFHALSHRERTRSRAAAAFLASFPAPGTGQGGPGQGGPASGSRPF